MALSVPQPTIVQEGADGRVLSEAKPICVRCAPVTFADGTPLEPQQATRAAYVLYRRPAGMALQAWDAATGLWRAADPAPEGEALFLQDGSWSGLIVPMGPADAAGKPQFDPVAAATYSVACSFAATDASGAAQSGSSPRSSTFTVVRPGRDYRGGIEIEPEDPEQATHLEMFLRDPLLTDRAFVSLDRDGDSYTVRIVADGAVIELSGGGITLTPADGTIHVHGSLDVSGSLSHNGMPSP